jgi:hypothetical protein
MMLQQLTWFGVRGERARVRMGRRDVRITDGRGCHENSLAAHDASAEVLTGRRALIVAWLAAHGRPATDREIAHGMFGDAADMNMVRPRVSELLAAGALEEVGKTRDALTGMTVRTVGVKGGA